jgi:hypothetical protein
MAWDSSVFGSRDNFSRKASLFFSSCASIVILKSWQSALSTVISLLEKFNPGLENGNIVVRGNPLFHFLQ